MADLAGALDTALRARYPVRAVTTPTTQRRGLTARMNQLEKKFSGERNPGAAAAKAAGIAPATWTRWKAGQRAPSKASLGKLDAAYNKLIAFPKLRRKVNALPVPEKVNVTADVVWNGYVNRVAKRTVKFRTNVRTVMVATIRAWGRQGPEAAADVFQRGLADAESNAPNTEDEPGIVFDGNEVEIDFP
jgi:hypothetical protein